MKEEKKDDVIDEQEITEKDRKNLSDNKKNMDIQISQSKPPINLDIIGFGSFDIPL